MLIKLIDSWIQQEFSCQNSKSSKMHMEGTDVLNILARKKLQFSLVAYWQYIN